jgi:hypothetical protein
MDRYEQLIHNVQQKTDDGTIEWRVVNAVQYSDLILNCFRVIRAFRSDYQVGTKKYELLFVEKKVDLHGDYGYQAEGAEFEVFVLDEDKQIVLSLYDGVVDRDDLLKLAASIDGNNDRVNAFFDAFGQTDVA